MRKAILFVAVASIIATSALADQVSAKFVSGGNDAGASGYLLSPYTGTITPPGGQATTIQLFCLDFNHDVSNGDTWTANVTAVTAADLSKTLYGLSNPNPSGPTGNKLYEEDAYLATNILSDFLSSDFTDIQPIQDAMWVLAAAPGANVPNKSTTAVQNWLTAASTYVQTASPAAFNGWYVLTDVNKSNPHQEFVFHTSNPGIFQTPEPATMFLTGTGLLAVFFAGRKWNRALLG